MIFEKLKEEEINKAKLFYKTQGYGGGISIEDISIVAKIDNRIIGLGRIAVNHGVNVIRGVYIDKNFQRRGIGSSILHALEQELNNKVAYCIPYKHLEKFYAKHGFYKVELNLAPQFLQYRFNNYIDKGLSCILMKRETYGLSRNG